MYRFSHFGVTFLVNMSAVLVESCYRPHTKDDGRLCFHRRLSVNICGWGGGPPSQVRTWGTPSHIRAGGTPSRSGHISGRRRYPPSRSGRGGGYSPSGLGLDGGTPPHQDWMGVRGYTPPPQSGDRAAQRALATQRTVCL